MTNEEAIEQLRSFDRLGIIPSIQMAINALMEESVYKQVKWERDIAIEQLKELGYSLGEKIKDKNV